jgi:pimeloyl-ACP methyl ester carboxylesterase
MRFTRLSTVIISALLALAGCASNGARIDGLAQSAGLQKRVVQAATYSLVVYAKPAPAPPERLFVFLEGDGNPWGSSGMQPQTDPTTRNPLALRLMIETPPPAIYVARPCYQGQADSNCSPERWTGGRYAEDVVASMVDAIESEAARLQANELVIVGYSGGGALAVLIAERMQGVVAVITMGANLDVAAWSRHHRYLPLTQSLNPALSDRPHPWKEFHFNGAQDAIVPAATADLYFKRYPQAQRFTIEKADHVCCWETDWPALLGGLRF